MISPALIHIVILTGGRDTHNALLAGTGLQSKTMLPVGGKPMALSVLETVSKVRFNTRIWMSTQDDTVQSLRTPLKFQTLPNDSGAVRSLLKALESLPAEGDWVLFVSGDHPLLTPEMVEYFLEEGFKCNAALVAAVVERDVVRQKYPQSQRTYYFAKDGGFSGGNLFLINRQLFSGNITFMETMDRNRKKPWKSVSMLNPLEWLQLAFRQLTLKQIAQEKASRIFGSPIDVVSMPFAECCMDVDKPSDRDLAELILAQREQETILPRRVEPILEQQGRSA